MTENKNLPKKNQIKLTYDTYVPLLAEILKNVELKLRDTIHLASNPTYKSRVKSFNSYYKKVIRLKAQEAAATEKLVPLTDMMGIRVICAFLEDLRSVESIIKENFKVKEVEYKGSEQNFKEFGYESIHVLIELPEGCVPETDIVLPEGTVCEIQIRTILQDAWAEVEHELIYKSEFTPFDMPLRRKLASINASLSLADIIFQEIRDYQNKLQSEVAARRETFYEMADELTVQKKKSEDEKNISRVSPYVHGTIDDMILDALHAHNSGDLDRALHIYTLVLDTKPTPPPAVLSVIHKHRGMAFFAQGKNKEALDDFQKSIENDPKGFRSMYYEGIVYSVMGQDAKAVESFTKSLEVNSYQSHAHYRRALSNFRLGLDIEALNDLNSAEQLGLNDKESQALREKIIKKLGMAM